MNPSEIEDVEASIDEVFCLFRRAPNVILTEDDFRFHLCNSLLPCFGSEERTEDGDRSVSLHTEVRWYGEGELRLRSDIVLIDVSTLNVLRHSRLPSKGFGFNIPKGIIELKLRRANGESNASFLKAIDADIAKLAKLKQVFDDAQGDDQTACWLLILDKRCDLNAQIPARDGIRIRYGGDRGLARV